METQSLDIWYPGGIRRVEHVVLDEASVEPGYALRCVHGSSGGEQALAGTRVMADGGVRHAGPQHHGRDRYPAPDPPHQVAQPVPAEDRADARDGVARSEDDHVSLAESIEGGGRRGPGRDAYLLDLRMRALLHIPLLEMQQPAVPQHDVGLMWLVAGRDHRHSPHPQSAREFTGRLRQRLAGIQQFSTQQVEGEVQIADIEPRRRAEVGERVTDPEGLAAA